jgi:flagellar biosynthetic protein FliP
MVAKFHPDHTEPTTEMAARATMSDAAGLVDTETPKIDRRVRSRLVSGWLFTRHLLEMVVAMLAGMALLGVAIWGFGEPPGYSNLLVEYALMGASMSALMVAWMRYRGHPWSDGTEMTMAMLVPAFAIVLPVELGILRMDERSLMMISHLAMIGGMVALMLYRWDRYADGAYGHCS